jgi:hypothetical protein
MYCIAILPPHFQTSSILLEFARIVELSEDNFSLHAPLVALSGKSNLIRFAYGIEYVWRELKAPIRPSISIQ